MADVDEQSQAFEALHHNSFAITARQRIWQLQNRPSQSAGSGRWRQPQARICSLSGFCTNNLVPALVQQSELFIAQHPKGVVYYEKGELKAFVESNVWTSRRLSAQPFIHPDTEDVAGLLEDLLWKIPNLRSRPVYICVRSYQAWLEGAVEEIGAEAGPGRQLWSSSLCSSKKVVARFHCLRWRVVNQKFQPPWSVQRTGVFKKNGKEKNYR